MTTDNVSPPLLTNNDVNSVLDYTAWQYTKETLTGTNVVLGDKTYTFFVNVFPKDPGPGKLLDPRDIAEALVSAINFDADGSGVLYDAVALQSANGLCEAYCRGAVITVLNRPVLDGTGGGGGGALPTLPSTIDTATAGSSAGTWTPLPAAIGARTFEIENLGTEPIQIRLISTPAKVFKINANFGSSFDDNPSLYEIISTTTNAQAVQIKVRYF